MFIVEVQELQKLEIFLYLYMLIVSVY